MRNKRWGIVYYRWEANQNFVQIPHGQLREKLAYLCELYGIKYVEQEESYTSKASFFDNDELPTYNADNLQKYTFSGIRITRGQYRTSTGYIFNADVNRALNILRKSKLVSLTTLQDIGCVLRPAASQPRRKVCYAQGYSGAVVSESRH